MLSGSYSADKLYLTKVSTASTDVHYSAGRLHGIRLTVQITAHIAELTPVKQFQESSLRKQEVIRRQRKVKVTKSQSYLTAVSECCSVLSAKRAEAAPDVTATQAFRKAMQAQECQQVIDLNKR